MFELHPMIFALNLACLPGW